MVLIMVPYCFPFPSPEGMNHAEFYNAVIVWFYILLSFSLLRSG